MDQKKDDDKKPALPIPTLRDAKNAPQLKIKGVAQGGLSLLERMKQFKKKDLAFILAGLGVLFLAPLAEHFMMAPDSDQGLQGGFGARDGGLFGKGGSPYEPGVNGLAPGGLAGGGSDVITPLNVRDPSALIMGPGGTQQPPATSTPAPAAPAKADNNDWKDALAQSAAKAAGAAGPKAALPVPKIPLSAGGLRGLGAVSGGGGGSYSLPPISAAGVPNRGNVGNSPSPTGGAGMRGARGDSQGGNPNSLDALKKAAQNAANLMNGPGSASSNLEQAASQAMPGGAAGGGDGEGSGSADKASGASGDKGSKNADGQSLAFLKAKEEQEKAIEFEWKKKEAGDLDLMWYKLRDKMAEEAIMTPFKAITGLIAKQITNFGTNSGDSVYCVPHQSGAPAAGSNPTTGLFLVQAGQIGLCGSTQAPNTDGSQTGNVNYCGIPASNGTDPQTNRLWYCSAQDCGQIAGSGGFDCSGTSDGTKPKAQTPPNYTSGSGPGTAPQAQIGQLCTQFAGAGATSVAASGTSVAGTAAPGSGAAFSAVAAQLQTAGANMIVAQQAMEQGNNVGGTNPCNNASATPPVNVPWISMSQNVKLQDQLGSNSNNVDNSTYKELLTAFNSINALYVRDSGATAKVLGVQTVSAQPDPTSSPLVTNTSKIRQYFTDAAVTPPVDATLQTDAQAAVTASAAIQKVYTDINGTSGGAANATANYGQNSSVDTAFNANVGNNGLIPKAQQQLTGIKTSLTAVGSALDAANRSMTAATAQAGNVGSTNQQYLTQFQSQASALQTEYQGLVGEYNRQAAASNGLWSQVNALQTQITPVNTTHEQNITGTANTALNGFGTAMGNVTGSAGGTGGAAATPNGTLPVTSAPPGTLTPVLQGGNVLNQFTSAAGPLANPDNASSPYIQPHMRDAAAEFKLQTPINQAQTTLNTTPTASATLQ